MPDLKSLHCHIAKLLKNNITISKRSEAKQYNNLTILHGFSLVEILLALFIVTALVTILFSTTGTLFTTRKSRQEALAAKIATKKIENLRNTAFSNLPGDGQPVFCTNDSDLTQDLQNLKSGTCRVDTDNFDGEEDTDTKIKQVIVQIDWKNDNGSTHDPFTLTTLIYENGL